MTRLVGSLTLKLCTVSPEFKRKASSTSETTAEMAVSAPVTSCHKRIRHVWPYAWTSVRPRARLRVTPRVNARARRAQAPRPDLASPLQGSMLVGSY